MKVAFVYIAEAYQCYHNALAAFEMASNPGVSVDIFYEHLDTPEHLERIRKAFETRPLPAYRLDRGVVAPFLQTIGMLGPGKRQIMRMNAARLNEYDAIVASENSCHYLRDAGVHRARLVYMPHGAGDGATGFMKETSKFDFVTPPGRKCADRMLAQSLVKPGAYATPGYIKLETVARLRASGRRLFADSKPIVLYNSHRNRELESWSRFVEPMISFFRSQDEFNLVIAPHMKMFARKSAGTRARWRDRSTSNVIVDPGSMASVDGTYLDMAAIYVGDASSQVYEFLARPRPCVFLNAHGIKWGDDPNYRHWAFGDVIESPEELPAAVRSAVARHAIYRPLQEAWVPESLGDIRPGAAKRAGDAILDYLRRTRT